MDNENKKSCSEITDDLLADFTDGRLGNELRRKVEKHLKECESCRIRAQDIKIIAGALRGDSQLSEDIHVPERIDRAVLGTIREVAAKQRARNSWLLQKRFWVISSVSACVLLVVIIGLTLSLGRSYHDADNVAMDMQKGMKYEQEDEEKSAISGLRTLKSANELTNKYSRTMDETGKRTRPDIIVAEKPAVDLESTVGDMDGNRVVDVADALSICRQLLENKTIDYRKQRDANGDGRIDIGDALHIINRALKEQG